jgi:hypothetical protein
MANLNTIPAFAGGRRERWENHASQPSSSFCKEAVSVLIRCLHHKESQNTMESVCLVVLHCFYFFNILVFYTFIKIQRRNIAKTSSGSSELQDGVCIFLLQLSCFFVFPFHWSSWCGKVKLSMYRPWRPLGFRIFRHSAHRWRQSCQPYAPAAFSPPRRFLVLISVRGCVDPRAIVRLEGLGKLGGGGNHLIRDSNRWPCGL